MTSEKDKELAGGFVTDVLAAVADSGTLAEKLEALRDKVPDFAKPWVDEWGPVMLQLAAKDGGKELRAFIYRVSVGDVEAAYRSLIDKLPTLKLVTDALTKINVEWRQHANDQAEKMEARNAAVAAMVKILIPIAIAALGF